MLYERVQSALRGRVLLREETLRLALAALLSGGHLLMEDVPGTGKTTFAKALARVLGLSFGRIQMTPDLLPQDLTGVYLYREGSLVWEQGPIFAQVLLVDELNRATPRTQSALLEAMGEGQVTLEGKTHPLPEPFFVLATQNPVEEEGTFPLPVAQRDRFAARLALGYPDEKALLEALRGQDPLEGLAPVTDAEEVLEDLGRHLADLVSRWESRDGDPDGGDGELGRRLRGACSTLGRDLVVTTPAGRVRGRAVDLRPGLVLRGAAGGPAGEGAEEFVVSTGEALLARLDSPA